MPLTLPWRAVGLIIFVSVGLAATCREGCRGALFAVGLAAAIVSRYAQGKYRGLPRHDMTCDISLACLGHCRGCPRRCHEKGYVRRHQSQKKSFTRS